jgi:hypothetical protein
VIGAPPVFAGAPTATVAEAIPAETDVTVGALGATDGMAQFENVETSPEPAPLTAVTVNRYDVPLVRPVNEQVVADPVVQVRPPGSTVTT